MRGENSFSRNHDFEIVVRRHFQGNDYDLVMFAHDMAVYAHAGQAPRQNGDPYIRHPERVAMRMAEHRLDVEYVWLGLLHDVFEDAAHFNADDVSRIRTVLGSDIVADLQRLTKRYANPQLVPPGHTGADYYQILRRASIRVQVVKMFDRLDNLRDINEKHISKEKRRRVKQTTRAHLLLCAQEILREMNRTDRMRHVLEYLHDEFVRLCRG